MIFIVLFIQLIISIIIGTVFAFFEFKKKRQYYAPLLLIAVTFLFLSRMLSISISPYHLVTGTFVQNLFKFPYIIFIGIGCFLRFLLPGFRFSLIVISVMVIYYLFLAGINLTLKQKGETLKSRIRSKWPIILIHLFFSILGLFLGMFCT